jgi:tetratricopeptide (TPR) repeat protein
LNEQKRIATMNTEKDLVAEWIVACEDAIARGDKPPPVEQLPVELREEALRGLRQLGVFDKLHPPAAIEGPPSQPPDTPRYQFVGFIAQGGMGEVWRGYDRELRREVAVKVLRHRLRDPEAAEYFRNEAELAARLQHPSIVPVHDVGILPDGRPFFVMKLVQGQTLASLLARRSHPSEDLPRFVQWFGQICQAVGYAHAQRPPVLHRDLKPNNVMVGQFGEVQVMDWGIAKSVAGRQGAPPSSHLDVQPSKGKPGDETEDFLGGDHRASGLETITGTGKGTPQYMAPEQARGDKGAFGPHTDVFGLGGILCAILTGKPTRPDGDLGRARTGDNTEVFERLQHCASDAELVRLAKSCLAADPKGRPDDAGVVAAAVTAYQESVAQRLRATELERAAESARVEEAKATAAQERRAKEAAQAHAAAERRARRLTVGLATTVLLLVTFGAGGGLWIQQLRAEQDAEEARKRQAVEASLDKAKELRQKERGPEAEAILAQVQKSFNLTGPDDLRQRLTLALAEIAVVNRFDRIRQRRASIMDGSSFDNRATDRDYAEVFNESGFGKLSDPAEHVAARIRESSVAEQVVAAFDAWAAVTGDHQRRGWLLDVTRQADPDTWRDRFRDPTVKGDRAALEILAAELLREKANHLGELKPPLLAALGKALFEAKGDAVPLLAAAQATYPNDFWLNYMMAQAMYKGKQLDEALGYYRGALALQPNSASTRNNLGVVLKGLGRLDEAIREYKAAILIDSGYAMPRTNLGNALQAKKQLDDAIREHRMAVAIDPNYALAHGSLGIALRSKGQLDDAIQAFQKAIAIDPNYAEAFGGLGYALRDKGQLDNAIRQFRKAIDLDPDYAQAYGGLGLALGDKGQLDDAIKEYRKAIAIDPKLVPVYINLGNAMKARGRLDDAIGEFQKAIAINPNYAQAYVSLGAALGAKGKLEDAIRKFQKAIDLNPKLANAHYNLGFALHAKGQLDDAILEYQLAIACDPKRAASHNNLGNALKDKGRLDDAIEEFQKAIDLDPKYALAHNNLGTALLVKGRLDDAIETFQAAIDLNPKDAVYRFNLGNALAARKQLDNAIREYRAAIVLQPTHAAAHYNLGHLLLDKKQYTEALTMLRRSDELGRKLRGWNLPSGNSVRQAELLVDREVKLSALLKGEYQPKDNADRLALIKACRDKKIYLHAARLYSDSFAGDPKMADDVAAGHRYKAACYAVLATASEDEDGEKINEKDRAHWRMQALGWLRADLVLLAKLLDNEMEKDRSLAMKKLLSLKEEADFESVRDSDFVARLAEQERTEWRQLWTNLDALIRRAGHAKQ